MNTNSYRVKRLKKNNDNRVKTDGDVYKWKKRFIKFCEKVGLNASVAKVVAYFSKTNIQFESMQYCI